MSSIILWGLTASPYQLKMQALLDFAGRDWQRWPEQASPWQALRMALRLRGARRSGLVKRFPDGMTELDEYPAVPFYCLNDSELDTPGYKLLAGDARDADILKAKLKGTGVDGSLPTLIMTECILVYMRADDT